MRQELDFPKDDYLSYPHLFRWHNFLYVLKNDVIYSCILHKEKSTYTQLANRSEIKKITIKFWSGQNVLKNKLELRFILKSGKKLGGIIEPRNFKSFSIDLAFYEEEEIRGIIQFLQAIDFRFDPFINKNLIGLEEAVSIMFNREFRQYAGTRCDYYPFENPIFTHSSDPTFQKGFKKYSNPGYPFLFIALGFLTSAIAIILLVFYYPELFSALVIFGAVSLFFFGVGLILLNQKNKKRQLFCRMYNLNYDEL